MHFVLFALGVIPPIQYQATRGWFLRVICFAVGAFIVFSDFGAFIVVAFGAIVTFFAFIETGAYALLRKLRSMSHNGFARTSLCRTCVASFHIARRTRTHNVSGGIA